MAIALFVLLLPSFTSLSPFDDVLTPQVALLYLVALVGIIDVIRSFRGGGFQLDIVQIGLLTLAIGQTVTFVVSADPKTSLLGLDGLRQGFVTQVAYLLVFVLSYRVTEAAEDGRRLLTLLVMGSVPVAAYGVIRLIHLDWVLWIGGVKQEAVFATVGGPNEFAGYLLLVVPGVFHLTSSSRNLTSLASAVFAGLLAFLLLLTGSRAAIVSFATAIVFAVILCGKWKRDLAQLGASVRHDPCLRPRVRRPGRRFMILVLLFLIGVLMVVSPVRTLYQRPASPSGFLDTTSNFRIELWEIAIRAAAFSPFLGYGQDAAPIAANRAGERVPWIAEMSSVWHVSSFHNWVLDRLISSGLIGLGAFAGMFTALAQVVAWRFGRLDARSRAVLVCASMSITGFLVHSLLNPVYVSNEAMFWVLAGIVYGLVRRENTPALPSERLLLSQVTDVARKAWERGGRLGAIGYRPQHAILVAACTTGVLLLLFIALGSPWPKPLGVPGPLPQPPPYPLSPFPVPFSVAFGLPQQTAHILFRLTQLATLAVGLRLVASASR